MKRNKGLVWLVVLACVLLAPLYVWYLNIGGIYHLIKTRSKKLVCSVDADCPPGYVCVDGFCVPAS